MKKERIVIILIVLIIGGFFLVKSIKSDSIALSNNNILNETKKEDKINNVVQYQEDSKTNITNENIKENKEESNISKKHSVEKSYFNDALFIGDSRTIGISEYGDLNNATFFAYTGMSVYNVFSKTVSVPKVGKLNLEQLLSSKKFGKIYIMLGINELGYNTNQTLENYKKLVDYIKDSQSSAIIYIQANLHVASKKSE